MILSFLPLPSQTNSLTSLLFLSRRRSHLLCRFCAGCVFPLPHHFFLVHLLGVVDVDVRPLFLRDVSLLLLVVVEHHAQVFEDCGGDFVAEVFDGRGNLVQVQLKNVVLSVARVVVPAGNCETALAAERELETKG